MTIRRFEQGMNFFEVEVKGAELVVNVGQKGRGGQAPKPRAKASPAEAKAEMDKLIAAHLSKGYVEVALAPDPEIARTKLREKQQADDVRMAAVAAETGRQKAAALAVIDEREKNVAFVPRSNPALEALCTDGDPAPWQVYADWLIEMGDPRGTIASTFFAKGEKAADALCAKHTPSGRIKLRYGFAHTAAISGPKLLDKLKTLLASPIASTVRELRVGLADGGDWGECVSVVAASPLASKIHTLTFDASDRLLRDGADRLAPNRDEAAELFGTAAPVRFTGAQPWRRLTALEALTIDGPFDGRIDLESSSIRRVTIRSDALYADLVFTNRIFKNLSNLEKLVLNCPSLDADEIARLRADLAPIVIADEDELAAPHYRDVME